MSFGRLLLVSLVFAELMLTSPTTFGSESIVPPAAAKGGNAILKLSSGSLQTPLLELYTSEGCSSCPPADRWLQALGRSDGLWRRFVPVAFHVTYWNQLGWRDRFSQSAFDARQRALAQRAGSGVYTPGVFLQGREWRQWRRNAGSETLRAAERPRIGLLQAQVACNAVQIRFTPDRNAAAKMAATVELAWLQSGQTKVHRGENRGKWLEHAFVVAEHRRVPLLLPDAHGHSRAQVPGRCDDRGHQAIAIWVTDRGSNPLQAIGGNLPRGFYPVAQSDLGGG